MLLPLCVFAQQPKTFEVASVKVRDPKALIVAIGASPSGSRLTMEAMSLADLVAWAYDVKVTHVLGGPSWAREQRDRSTLDGGVRQFGIAVKAEVGPPPSLDDFRRMMQTLQRDDGATRGLVLERERGGPSGGG